jgi:hypothetical protein
VPYRWTTPPSTGSPACAVSRIRTWSARGTGFTVRSGSPTPALPHVVDPAGIEPASTGFHPVALPMSQRSMVLRCSPRGRTSIGRFRVGSPAIRRESIGAAREGGLEPPGARVNSPAGLPVPLLPIMGPARKRWGSNPQRASLPAVVFETMYRASRGSASGCCISCLSDRGDSNPPCPVWKTGASPLGHDRLSLLRTPTGTRTPASWMRTRRPDH